MKHIEFFSHVGHTARTILALNTWQDYAEICILTSIMYLFLGWLNKDTTARPILFFHSYLGLLALTYLTQLSLLSTVLLTCSPIAVVLLILMHQHSLQKNLIVPKVIKHVTAQDLAWVDELMRTLLGVLNKQQELTCLIERSDALRTLIHAPYYLRADIKKELLELFIEHIDSAAGQMLWIEQTGKVLAINSQLTALPEQHQLVGAFVPQDAWKQDAVFLTSNTDALIMRICVNSRLFTCVAQGKIIEGLTAPHLQALLKKYLTTASPQKKDTYLYGQPQSHSPKQQPP